jgi:hypothetical protein
MVGKRLLSLILGVLLLLLVFLMMIGLSDVAVVFGSCATTSNAGPREGANGVLFDVSAGH